MRAEKPDETVVFFPYLHPMQTKFNITGTCLPHLHYMMDNSAKLAGVMKMIVEGEYFTINRPRQYGKTTTMMIMIIQGLLAEPPEFIPTTLTGRAWTRGTW